MSDISKAEIARAEQKIREARYFRAHLNELKGIFKSSGTFAKNDLAPVIEHKLRKKENLPEGAALEDKEIKIESVIMAACMALAQSEEGTKLTDGLGNLIFVRHPSPEAIHQEIIALLNTDFNAIYEHSKSLRTRKPSHETRTPHR